MQRQLSDADLEEFTPAEIEALRGTATADESATPVAETDDAEPDAVAVTEAEAEAKPQDAADSPAAGETKAEGAEAQGETSTAPPDADTLAEVLAESQPADAPRYELPDTASVAEQRKALREQRAAIDAKWLTGGVTDAERAQQVGTIEDQLDELLQRATRAETLAEVNRQNARAEQGRVLDTIRREGAKVGVDYMAEGEAAAQFDTALQLVAARKDMAGKPFEDLAQQAHRMVLALLGKLPQVSPPPATSRAAAPAVAAPATAPAPKPPREIPPTLGHMPAAARAPIANDFMSEFASIDDPDRAEEMLANMPARQREALLRATVKVQ